MIFVALFWPENEKKIPWNNKNFAWVARKRLFFYLRTKKIFFPHVKTAAAVYWKFIFAKFVIKLNIFIQINILII